MSFSYRVESTMNSILGLCSQFPFSGYQTRICIKASLLCGLGFFSSSADGEGGCARASATPTNIDLPLSLNEWLRASGGGAIRTVGSRKEGEARSDNLTKIRNFWIANSRLKSLAHAIVPGYMEGEKIYDFSEVARNLNLFYENNHESYPDHIRLFPGLLVQTSSNGIEAIRSDKIDLNKPLSLIERPTDQQRMAALSEGIFLVSPSPKVTEWFDVHEYHHDLSHLLGSLDPAYLSRSRAIGRLFTDVANEYAKKGYTDSALPTWAKDFKSWFFEDFLIIPDNLKKQVWSFIARLPIEGFEEGKKEDEIYNVVYLLGSHRGPKLNLFSESDRSEIAKIHAKLRSHYIAAYTRQTAEATPLEKTSVPQEIAEVSLLRSKLKAAEEILHQLDQVWTESVAIHGGAVADGISVFAPLYLKQTNSPTSYYTFFEKNRNLGWPEIARPDSFDPVSLLEMEFTFKVRALILLLDTSLPSLERLAEVKEKLRKSLAQELGSD